jgi:hypothetical protein
MAATAGVTGAGTMRSVTTVRVVVTRLRVRLTTRRLGVVVDSTVRTISTVSTGWPAIWRVTTVCACATEVPAASIIPRAR